MKAKIAIAIGGGIAAYKIPNLVRLFVKSGCEVKVVTSKNALNFVTETTLRTVSCNGVYSEMFSNNGQTTEHISLSDWADVFVVAPATADVIGKYANAIADDCLTTTLLAFDKTVFVAPAMNTKMYNHKGVQDNLQTLLHRGVKLIEPDSGELACGASGKGRMAEPEQIFREVERYFESSNLLCGKTVCVTAGPTYEQIDPVRFIGNYSSGKMGYALAEACALQGASVTLVSGPVHLDINVTGIERINVENAKEMYEATTKRFADTDIAILCAAVADFRPTTLSDTKIKREKDLLHLSLEPTQDIAASLGKMKKENQRIIGFALETDDEEHNALDKLKRKNLDFIVLNSLKNEGAGFMVDTNQVTILSSHSRTSFPCKPKQEVAEDIIAALCDIL